MTNPTSKPIPPFEMSPLIAVGDTGGVMLNGSLLSCVTRDTEKNESTIEFTLDLYDSKVNNLFTEMPVTFRGRTYNIRTITYEASPRSGGSTVKVYAERSWYDLLYSGKLGSMDWEATDARTCLNTILADTQWTVGTIDQTLSATWKMSEGTALAQVNQVGETYGLQPVFEEDSKKVHLLKDPGRDRGTTFSYYKDVTKASRRIDTTGLITRIYGQSKDGVTIASVNGGKPYLEDYSYSQDLRIAYYDFKEGISPSDMKRLMEAYLFMRAKPVISYEFELSGLGDRASEIERFDIFDTVFVMDEDYASSVRAKVVGLTIDWLNLYKSKIELGNTLVSLARVADQGNGNAPGRISTEDTPKSQVPASPTGITTSSSGYWDGDLPVRMLTVKWDAVSKAVDGSNLSIDSYEVSLSNGAIVGTSTLQATLEGLPAGKETLVKVRAIAKGISGAWSSPITAPADAPTVVPPVPAGVTAISNANTVTIKWNGTVQEGSATVPAPKRVSHVEVEQATSLDGPWTSAGVILKEQDPLIIVYDKDMNGKTAYYRSRTVDYLGTASGSGWSNSVSTVIRDTWSEELQDKLDTAAADVEQAQRDVALALDKVNTKVDTTAFNKAMTENSKQLSALDSSLSTLDTSLNQLKNTTIPGISAELDSVKADALSKGLLQAGNLVWNPRLVNKMNGWKFNSPLSGVYNATGGPGGSEGRLSTGVEYVRVSYDNRTTGGVNIDIGYPNPSTYFEVKPNQEFFFSIWIRPTVTIPANGIGFGIDNMNRVYSPQLPENTWTKITGTLKVGANPTNKGSWFRIYHNFAIIPSGAQWDISSPFLIEKSDTDLIVDGAIIANKLSANSVTSEKLVSGSVVAGKLATNAVTADNIQANAVVAGKIATDAVTANNIQSNAITSNKIQAGAVTSREVAANSITATHLRVAPGNLFPDPHFKDPSWPWNSNVHTGPSNGGELAFFANGTHNAAFLQPEGKLDASVTLVPGAEYALTAGRYADNEQTRRLSVYANYKKPDGSTYYGWLGYLTTPGLGVYTTTMRFKAPADMVGGLCSIGFALEPDQAEGFASIWNVNLVRAADASLIVDGSIKAQHLEAGTITATQVNADEIFLKATGDKSLQEQWDDFDGQLDTLQSSIEFISRLATMANSTRRGIGMITSDGVFGSDETKSLFYKDGRYLSASGSWKGRVIFIDSDITVTGTIVPDLNIVTSNGNLNLKYASLSGTGNRSLYYKGNVAVFIWERDPVVESTTTIKPTATWDAPQNAWTTIPGMSTTLADNSISTSVNGKVYFTNVNRGSMYGVRVLVGGKVVWSWQSNTVGPLTPLGAKTWNISVRFERNVSGNETVQVQFLCNDSTPSKRRVTTDSQISVTSYSQV